MAKAILKIASQMEIRTHRVYGGKKNKVKREQRAKRNAQLLWEECGILVKDWFTVDGMVYYNSFKKHILAKLQWAKNSS